MAPAAYQQRGRKAASTVWIKIPGLRRPCLESGRAWASATRKEEARAILAMPRCGGRSKVYRELLRQCRDGVLPADLRAVSSIGARLGITERQVRKHLAALEAGRWIVKVHHAGLRLPGQCGWTTNVVILPALLPSVQLLPPGAREKARKLLLGKRVRTALMTLGYARQLRQAVGRFEAIPAFTAAVNNEDRRTNNLSISTPIGLGSDFVFGTVSSSVTQISIVSPYPLKQFGTVDNQPPGTVVRANARPDSKPPSEIGSVGRDRTSSANLSVRPSIDEERGTDLEHPGLTRRPRDALRGLTPTEVVSVLEAEGVPRSEAIQRATGFARVAAWRWWRQRAREPTGRKPRERARLRAARYELLQLRTEKTRCGADLDDECDEQRCYDLSDACRTSSGVDTGS